MNKATILIMDMTTTLNYISNASDGTKTLIEKISENTFFVTPLIVGIREDIGLEAKEKIKAKIPELVRQINYTIDDCNSCPTKYVCLESTCEKCLISWLTKELGLEG